MKSNTGGIENDSSVTDHSGTAISGRVRTAHTRAGTVPATKWRRMPLGSASGEMIGAIPSTNSGGAMSATSVCCSIAPSSSQLSAIVFSGEASAIRMISSPE